MADEIDLQRLWGLLVDHRWLIIGTTFIALCLGVAYALLATPRQQSKKHGRKRNKHSKAAAL